MLNATHVRVPLKSDVPACGSGRLAVPQRIAVIEPFFGHGISPTALRDFPRVVSNDQLTSRHAYAWYVVRH